MFRNARINALLWQAVFIGGVIAVAVWLVGNTLDNLAKLNVKSGFAFLRDTAGFDFSPSFIPFDPTSTYFDALVAATVNTLVAAAITCVLTTILGFLIGIARLSRNWLLARMAMIYVETLRNIPLLLQLVFWYFAVLAALPKAQQSLTFWGFGYLNVRGLFLPAASAPSGGGAVLGAVALSLAVWFLVARRATARRVASGHEVVYRRYLLPGLAVFILAVAVLTGFSLELEYPELKRTNFVGGIAVTPEFFALIVGLTLYHSALTAEVVRSGIQSVGHGQREAALALGLRPGQIMRKVIMPQALWVITPQLTSNYLSITKDTSLAAAIAFPELVTVMTGPVLIQSGQSIEVIAIVMAVYLVISLSISAFMNWYDRRKSRTELR